MLVVVFQYMFDMASEQDTIILSVEQDDIDLTKTSGVNHRQIGVQIIKASAACHGHISMIYRVMVVTFLVELMLSLT